jgi:hypothetical protein
MPIRILYFDADPDPEWHQNDADPHTDPSPSYTHGGKSKKFLDLQKFTAVPNPHWFNILVNDVNNRSH